MIGIVMKAENESRIKPCRREAHPGDRESGEEWIKAWEG
jgi:hypothetical protein